MFSKKQTKKIDLSFLKYLNEDNIATPQVTMEQVKKDYPHTKNSNLEACKLFYGLNYHYLDEEQRAELLSKINMLQQAEEKKFKIAFNTIEACQKQSELIQD
jgi:hypothetical protein